MDEESKTQKNNFYKTKQVQYWGFHAILSGNQQKIKVVLKQIGDGNIIFWSVMPFKQRLYSNDIYD